MNFNHTADILDAWFGSIGVRMECDDAIVDVPNLAEPLALPVAGKEGMGRV